MRVFVTGVNGQLGHDVVNELLKRGHTVIGSVREAGSLADAGDTHPEAGSLADAGASHAETGCRVDAGNSHVETGCRVDAGNSHVEAGCRVDAGASHAEAGCRVDVGNSHVETGCRVDAGSSYATSASYVSLDITDRAAVHRVIKAAAPDVVINCAAWTAVDAAEDPDKAALVHAVNADGPRYIAEVCRELDCRMIHISTDYVFDGQGTEPWKPDCKSYKPLNVYGRTKLEGEQAVSSILEKYYIVRIAWVFGSNGGNFVRTMINVGRTHDEVRVVNDQIGTPTYTVDLARLLADMSESDRYGYYHATNEGGYISWYDFCVEIYRLCGITAKVIPVTTAEYGRSVAARPFNSRLDRSKLVENGFTPLPDWRDALSRYVSRDDMS